MHIAKTLASNQQGGASPQPTNGVKTMSKLVNAWIENPTEKNAIRIFNHIKKHPMSVIMVDSTQHKAINQALESLK